MEQSISSLQAKWKKEKDYYKTQEVGSGVQIFVKEILRCGDLFNLKAGKLSTPLLKRKSELIEEYKTKSGRQVDVAIFISPEIVIPIEVEQYTHIERGESQLFQYQEDLDKKYGILTDGYHWRFYNNNFYVKFTLEQILGSAKDFFVFWNEYIKPENYYISFFEQSGQLSLFEVKLYVEKYRQMFFSDIKNLIASFKEKLKIEGYFQGLEKIEKERRAVEITYAYIIQFILYKTLVDNAFDEFPDDYRSRIKNLSQSVKNADYKSVLGVINGISSTISKNIYYPFSNEQQQIQNKLFELYQSIENKLSDVSPWLDIFIFIKKYNFQNVRNEIFGFIYENFLAELFEEENLGQKYTDSSVVNFMLYQIGFTADKIRDIIKAGNLEALSIIDPSCGSGTFLYSAVNEIIRSYPSIDIETSKEIEEIVNKNIYGLDIEEFPLYLAEMSILMRLLPLIINEKYNNPLAYVLLHALRRRHLQGTTWARAQFDTIRLQVLKIGARVRQLRTRIRVHLPSSYPWQAEWAKIWGSCRGSP